MSTEKKVMTKYDRKVQRRKEEERREKRARMITKYTLIAVIAAVVITSVTTAALHFNKVFNKYIVVDNKNISQVEFDFYYGLAKNAELSTSLYGTMTYGEYYVSYLGYDASKSDKKQNYSDELSWYDHFAENAVDTMIETKTLLKLADEDGYEYDSAKDYEDFKNDIKDAAKEADISVREYYKNTFGSYASEARVKSYICDYLKASSYQNSIRSRYAATTDEVNEYYLDNKDLYDELSYRIFTVEAEDSTDVKMAEAKLKADEFASKVYSEDRFVELCKEYAPSGEDKYKDDKASLVTGETKNSMNTAISEWVCSDERIEGDMTVIEDKNNSSYHVIYYLSKTYDSEEYIADLLLSQNYSKFIKEHKDAVKVNVLKRFKYGEDK